MKNKRQKYKQNLPRNLKLWRDERGATALEYGLIAALLSVAVLAVVNLMRDEIADAFNDASGAISESRAEAAGEEAAPAEGE